jgi:hypothetical protein
MPVHASDAHKGMPMTPEAAENIDLSQLRAEVQRQMDSYVYKVPAGAIGSSWSADAIADGISEMRGALVDPYWITAEIRDTLEQIKMKIPLKRRCAAVADDGKGMVLLFDPGENSFVLAQRVGAGLSTIGVRGDAVGCFLAR